MLVVSWGSCCCSRNSWKRRLDLWWSICPYVCQCSLHRCVKCIHAAGMFAALVFSGSFFLSFRNSCIGPHSFISLLLSNNVLERNVFAHICLTKWTLVLGSDSTNGEDFDTMTLWKLNLCSWTGDKKDTAKVFVAGEKKTSQLYWDCSIIKILVKHLTRAATI